MSPPPNDIALTSKSDKPIPHTTHDDTIGDNIFFQYLYDKPSKPSIQPPIIIAKTAYINEVLSKEDSI